MRRVVPGLNIASDDFELFGLPRQFEHERSEIDTRWRTLQGEVHPDRFAGQGASAQRLAMQWAVRVNEAYQRLKDPLRRAAYLCELNGAPIEAENNTAMPTEFLMQQMEWREALDDAHDLASVEALLKDVQSSRSGMLSRLHWTLDERGDYATGALQVRALMFVERFADDIDRRLEALGQ